MDRVGLGELKIPLQKVAPLIRFKSRGGAELGYRLYKALSENLIVLIHGVGGDSRYLTRLASALAEKNIANVVTPDLRGHGEIPHGPSAWVASKSQLLQDLEEILVHVRTSVPAEKILWAGHSLGGSLALKMALEPGGFWTKGALMIAPYFDPELGLSEPDLGGWIQQDGDVFKVNMPPEFRTGTEVLEYSRSFFHSASVPDIVERWGKAEWKSAVILAKNDSILNSAKAGDFLKQFPKVKVEVLEGTHLGIVAAPKCVDSIVNAAQALL